MNREEINNKLEFMQELANRFPTKDDAVTEIINLNAILALPRGPEHFMSDLHGQADAFTHILNNSAGGIKFRIWQLFNGTLTQKEQDELAGKEGSTKVTVGSNTTKKAEDLAEAYSVELKDVKNHEYILVNTSGKVIDNKGKNKDGNDYYYVTDSKGVITNVYVEN